MTRIWFPPWRLLWMLRSLISADGGAATAPVAPGHTHPATRRLQPYVRALWSLTPHFAQLSLPAVQSADESTALDEARRQRPLLITRSAVVPAPTLYLPGHWQQGDVLRAAVAHASAHLAYGEQPQPRGKLKPIQLALTGMLEDARVEARAIAQLPGLRALWLPWHQADASSGNTFEALLQRVQRSLLDPHYTDPHAWVRKACAVYHAAPPTSAGMRQTASLLGNDIGQLRMQFNARLYVVEPAYRDDNAHLWEPDPEALPATTSLSAPSNPEEGQPQGDSADPAPQPTEQPGEADSAQPTASYGEWDRISRRTRPKWCQVYEEDAPIGTAQAQQALSQSMVRHASLLTRLGRALLQGVPHRYSQTVAGRAAEGERFHLNALVHAAIDQRLCRQPDPYIYLHPQRAPQPLHVLLLLDASVSTLRSAPFTDASADGGNLLEALREAALLCAAALEQAGHYCAVQAFASNTRHQVRVQRIKGFADRADSAATLARLAGVQAEWSTRMGAALRHACAQLRGEPRAHVMLITDGQPHDIDVYDSRYLLADLQHAAREARRAGVVVSCLNVLGHDAASKHEHREMQRTLGAHACHAVSRLGDLPRLLLANLTR
jgi:nitric oxide reductase NorD protein